MARMYSKKKGKSGSKRPVRKTKQTWMRYTSKEIELLVGKLSKKGKTSAQIGAILKDTYGIPSVKSSTNKGITKIMEEKGTSLEIPEDLMALIKRSILLKKHFENNRQDKTANRGLELTESKIRRMVKYYKDSKKLAQDWKYDPSKIKLMIE